MARLAYRRPVKKADVDTLLQFFDSGAQGWRKLRQQAFQFALERMLVDPDFLLRVHRDPAEPKGKPARGSYRLNDIELASRLSFFFCGAAFRTTVC